MMIAMSSAGSPVDGDPIRFEIRDGIHRISCAVTDEALEAVSGLTSPSTAMLRRRSFDRFRALINAAAKLKLTSRPVCPIILTSEDLRRVPPDSGEPLFGSSARNSTRGVPPIRRGLPKAGLSDRGSLIDIGTPRA